MSVDRRKRRLSSGWGLKLANQKAEKDTENVDLENNDDQAELEQIRTMKARQRRKTLGGQDVRRAPLSELSNQPSGPALGSAQLADLYQECLSLATANKINQKNAFSLQLIDHMSSMLNGSAQGGTNFQKASCTLDASVKIYSYRVDSVHSDTYKVLGGLSRSQKTQQRNNNNSSGDEDDSDDDGSKKKKKKRRSARTAATIEKNTSNLDAKNLESQYAVDPLFKKTSAAFDEGGPSGLLMNNLGVFRGCNLVFDSTDIVDDHGANNNEETEEEETKDTPADATTNEETTDKKEENKQETVDVTALRLASTKPVNTLVVCPVAREMRALEKLWSHGAGDDEDTSSVMQADSYNSDDDDDGDSFGGFDFTDNVGLEQAMEREEALSNALDDVDGADVDSVVPMAFASNPEPAAAASTGNATSFLPAGQANVVSFLDSTTVQSWAGASHWKFRKPAGAKASGSKGSKRQKRAAFQIDFSAPLPVGAFAKPPRSNSTLTEATINKMDPEKTTLPEDCHITAAQFQRFFICPQVLLRMGSQANSPAPAMAASSSQHAQEMDSNRDMVAEALQVDDVGALPQWNDQDDDSDGDNGGFVFNTGDAGPDGGGDAFATDFGLVAQPRKVHQIDIQYAKFAKKVDVRALKETMWSTIEAKTSQSQEDVDEEKVDQQTDKAGQSFQDLMQGLTLDEQQQKNVSVPFCFICLLHLANEKNLALETRTQNLADFVIRT